MSTVVSKLSHTSSTGHSCRRTEGRWRHGDRWVTWACRHGRCRCRTIMGLWCGMKTSRGASAWTRGLGMWDTSVSSTTTAPCTETHFKWGYYRLNVYKSCRYRFPSLMPGGRFQHADLQKAQQDLHWPWPPAVRALWPHISLHCASTALLNGCSYTRAGKIQSRWLKKLLPWLFISRLLQHKSQTVKTHLILAFINFPAIKMTQAVLQVLRLYSI